MEQEECYLRTRLHLCMARGIDEALQAALECHASPLVNNIMSFFEMTLPSEGEYYSQESKRPSKRARPSADDPLLKLFAMDPSRRYPVTLLPLATLHGPHSFLDRQEMVQYMVNKMRKTHNKQKLGPAVCWLRSTGDSTIRHCSTFLQEILRQVLC